MGWASASELFDKVAYALVKGGATDETKREALGPLIDGLRDMDWDTEDESCEAFKDDEAIRALFAERDIHPYSEDRDDDEDAPDDASPEHEAIVETLKDFSWGNFGLDEVESVESDEWAHALADAILAAVGDS